MILRAVGIIIPPIESEVSTVQIKIFQLQVLDMGILLLISLCIVWGYFDMVFTPSE
jgi:hypothetical protein